MTNKRFPVANTDPPLTIPWELAERAHNEFVNQGGVSVSAENRVASWARHGGLTEDELDEWAPGWRERATATAKR